MSMSNVLERLYVKTAVKLGVSEKMGKNEKIPGLCTQICKSQSVCPISMKSKLAIVDDVSGCTSHKTEL